MKFFRNRYVIREDVRPLWMNGPCVYLQGKTSAFSGRSLPSLADEAPAL